MPVGLQVSSDSTAPGESAAAETSVSPAPPVVSRAYPPPAGTPTQVGPHDLRYDFTRTKGEIVRLYHVERDRSFDLLEESLHKIARR